MRWPAEARDLLRAAHHPAAAFLQAAVDVPAEVVEQGVTTAIVRMFFIAVDMMSSPRHAASYAMKPTSISHMMTTVKK